MLMLYILASCDNQNYTLTIFNSAPDGKNVQEKQTITSATDSVAYARAATMYLLSVHAYRKMSDNAKPFINKPESFLLLDENGKNVDSIIGFEKAESIRKKLDTLIN